MTLETQVGRKKMVRLAVQADSQAGGKKKQRIQTICDIQTPRQSAREDRQAGASILAVDSHEGRSVYVTAEVG